MGAGSRSMSGEWRATCTTDHRRETGHLLPRQPGAIEQSWLSQWQVPLRQQLSGVLVGQDKGLLQLARLVQILDGFPERPGCCRLAGVEEYGVRHRGSHDEHWGHPDAGRAKIPEIPIVNIQEQQWGFSLQLGRGLWPVGAARGTSGSPLPPSGSIFTSESLSHLWCVLRQVKL